MQGPRDYTVVGCIRRRRGHSAGAGTRERGGPRADRLAPGGKWEEGE